MAIRLLGWFDFASISGLAPSISIDSSVNDKSTLLFTLNLFVSVVLIAYTYLCIYSEVFKEKAPRRVSSKK